jgi:hypothetical protein
MSHRLRRKFTLAAREVPRLHGVMAIAATLIVGLGVAGCGSSGSSSTTSTTAITKAGFLKFGNAICTKGNKAINKAGKQVFAKNQKPSAAAFNKFATGTLIPTIQSEISAVAALPVPSGDEATVKKIVDTAQADLNKAKANPALLKSNKLFAASNHLANSYGLTACGGG